MTSTNNRNDYIDSSKDDFQDVEAMNVGIPECEGLPHRQWNTRVVTLYHEDGTLVGEGTCHSVNSDLVLGANGPLGDHQVSIHITRIHAEDCISPDWIYSLRAWPIHLVHCRGASLRDHEARDNFNLLQANILNPTSSSSARPYTSAFRNPLRESALKSKELLTQDSINLVSSKTCCSKNCVQPFPRVKIRALRERMYQCTTFQFRAHMKMDVHRQIHRDSHGKRVVTVEGIDVCMQAWMHISGVPESTFYRYQTHTSKGRQALAHGNSGLVKPRKHTVQAAATLKCLLEKEADHMPHKTRTLKSGDKVVSMILPASFQWKKVLPEINEANAVFGLKEVSPSNLSKIRSGKFPEYDVKRPGDNFARCSTCDKYQSLRKGALVGSQSALKWSVRLDKHLAIARAHRELYYANRYHSHNCPHECLTIMHDKMDHAKTASPVISHKVKELDGFKVAGVRHWHDCTWSR